METKPNILIFMVDQLTAFVLSAYGGKVCKTPNIDRLAARGAVFESAYCAYPLCAPSRAAMMTGRLPSKIGAYDNGAEFPASIPTFAHHLRSAGYYTCLSGKMHFVGPDQFHGFEERLTPEIYPADMSWTPFPQKLPDAPEDDYGHTFGVSSVDTIRDAGPVARSMQLDYDEDVVHQAKRELFARARGHDQRPFLMTISLSHPHDPYVITPEFWDLYADDDIDPPNVQPIPVDERDPHSQSLYYHYSMDKAALTDADYVRARRGYYAMISYIDHQLGEVLATLDVCGFAENSTIIFTSDHGDMVGERGMWFKKTLFEPAVRVPLIVARPHQTATRVTTPVSLIDICPTLLDIAGIDSAGVSSAFDGRSLLRTAEGSGERGPVLIEHLDGGTASPRMAIRDGSMKYTCSRSYPAQLFDLSNDPFELNDLSGTGHAEEVRLGALAGEAWDLGTLQEELIASQTDRRVVDAALAIGRPETWDTAEPNSDRGNLYMRRGDDFPRAERERYLKS